MASSPKDKFDAAVKVIRGLPKNGPFQPSHELLLKFYSYYKQATEGPCKAPKPSFWDVVNKKKWEAWSSLGDMASEKAMILYVDELKKVSNHVRETYYPPQIVETMPQTEEVTCFLQKLDTFYEMVEDQENHNVKGTQPNGNIPSKSKESSDVEEELNHSENVTMLLKQDMKHAHEYNGIIPTYSQDGVKEEKANSNSQNHENGQENGLNGDHSEEELGQYDNDHDFVAITPKKEIDSSAASEPSRVNGDYQAWSDSETDYEEFCDTSDDVVEPFAPSFHGPVLRSPPTFDFPSTSTPTTRLPRMHPHYVHFLPNQSQAHGNSDSLVVNISESAGNPSANALNNSEYFRDESEAATAAPKGLINCRGGEEAADRDRRRRAQGSHGTSHSGSRHEAGSAGSGSRGGAGSSSSRGRPAGSGGGGDDRSFRSSDGSQSDLNEQIIVTLLRLQRDMSGVLNRLNSLEALVKEGKMERERQSLENKKHSWWPFNGLTFNSVAIIFLWPLLVHIVLTYISRRRRHFSR